MRLAFRVRVSGMEYLPRRKPFIICANHISWLDPITLAVVIPAGYRINFMAKKELFKNPIFAFVLRMVGAYPVDRKSPDYTSIRKSYQLLNEGHVLGLFPEGSRSKSGRLQKAQNGAALIAVRSGVPILPVAIQGPYRFFKPLQVNVGPPFVLPPLVYEDKGEKKEKLEAMSYEIMAHIKRLLPEYSAG